MKIMETENKQYYAYIDDSKSFEKSLAKLIENKKIPINRKNLCEYNEFCNIKGNIFEYFIEIDKVKYKILLCDNIYKNPEYKVLGIVRERKDSANYEICYKISQDWEYLIKKQFEIGDRSKKDDIIFDFYFDHFSDLKIKIELLKRSKPLLYKLSHLDFITYYRDKIESGEKIETGTDGVVKDPDFVRPYYINVNQDYIITHSGLWKGEEDLYCVYKKEDKSYTLLNIYDKKNIYEQFKNEKILLPQLFLPLTKKEHFVFDEKKFADYDDTIISAHAINDHKERKDSIDTSDLLEKVKIAAKKTINNYKFAYPCIWVENDNTNLYIYRSFMLPLDYKNGLFAVVRNVRVKDLLNIINNKYEQNNKDKQKVNHYNSREHSDNPLKSIENCVIDRYRVVTFLTKEMATSQIRLFHYDESDRVDFI